MMLNVKRLSLFVFGLLLAAFAVTPAGRAQTPDDREAVRQAMLDYVEGIYNVQPERLERSLHPDMVKRGYFRKQAADTDFAFEPMTREQLIRLAGNWNKDRKRPVDTYPKDVIVYEVVNQTASGKVIATWGIDYMHLAKHDGRWKILNILWQEPPPRQ